MKIRQKPARWLLAGTGGLVVKGRRLCCECSRLRKQRRRRVVSFGWRAICCWMTTPNLKTLETAPVNLLMN